jgi:hypothetical protein
VSGIGQPIYDRSAEYGTSPSGRLLGTINYGYHYFGLGHIVLTHEMAHAFMNHFDATPLANAFFGHWPLSTAAFGVIGMGSPNVEAKLTPLEDGTYRVDRQRPTGGANDLELYLFGLADPSEVPEQAVFDPRDVHIGDILAGPYTRVSIDDVIATYGPREPAWDGMPVVFRLATIVVSRGRLLTPLEMAYYDRGARQAEATERRNDEYEVPFSVATRGRGVVVAKLD